ncbi:hypothetical protein TEHN7126_2119 [Tetragenococcus halophilus subsp. halophilus]|uniref:BppU family phage baseplate upper protein n=1 Tax=Tetragenococcus halophilus TaxID=51669 RepID=UPI000CB53E7F|nr:BppU family phage baseplate upper protein [Tetragenococcus halophilus]GBD74012.1 hypothetical protein TEHN7125_2172 [Tetragenococcus halophilus subsp. halophilus]GBD76420.1 hypothetical protein TEHN7126_2119 [Tetragenococcus halophilus subsp. halophilus]
MPIRKKGDIDIRTSANGAKVKQTSYTFYSYDKKSAALYFQFRGQDGQPTDLGKATIHLVMILNDDGGKEFIPKSDEIEVISAIRGTAKYVLPEMLLSYSGEVTGYVYMDFDDGSQSDDGQFTFRIKQSMITHVLPKAGDKYVQDFEDVKERVEQAGDSATKDIEKAKDDAESQIGEYAGEVESAKDSTIEDIDKALPEVVESAKQDISSGASDVQSKASEASEDISGLVKTTEDARDNAESQIGEYVVEVESAKDSATKDIEKAKDNAESQIGDYVGEVESAKQDISSSASDVQSKASEASEDISNLIKSTEDARDNAVESMYEIDYSDRNLLKGTSNEWKSYSFEGWTKGSFSYTLEELGLSVGDTITYSVKFDNTKDDNKDTTVSALVNFYNKDDKLIGSIKGNEILSGEIGLSYVTDDIPEGTTKISAYKAYKSDGDYQKLVAGKEHKLQFGNRATPWTPAPEDIVLKSELEKIKQAIINLGGSI